MHHVLEAIDFAAPDLDAELAARVREALARRPLDVGRSSRDAGRAACGARDAARSARRRRAAARHRAPRDRLDELEFELPLVGGDDPDGAVDAGRGGRAPARAPPRRRPACRATPTASTTRRCARLRGYLTGSIDAVLRLPGEDGTRFAVVDYKTNRLGGADEPLTAWHYRPAALGQAMQDAHYALQALLYTVALHRYLRWRLPGYDPDRHLAGVLYLFVRGMVGADTPAVDGDPCGVFAWRPPAALVEALSDALDAAA